jgi:FkbM family methyltransferase
MNVFSVLFRKIRSYYSKTSVELRRISRYPRYTPGRTVLEGGIDFTDSASFIAGYQEIFLKQNYLFKTSSSTPRIIDCGSNIGLSVLFLKKKFPGAVIDAFEPDPVIFSVLKKNIDAKGFAAIKLHNTAISSETGELKFKPDGGFSGKIVTDESAGLITVKTEKLSPYLEGPVDFLKIDIEGAETAVLHEIKNRLHFVKNLFIEYHSVKAKEQSLDQLLGILKENGFRVHIKEAATARHPFIEVPLIAGMDNQLEIYARREE